MDGHLNSGSFTEHIGHLSLTLKGSLYTEKVYNLIHTFPVEPNPAHTSSVPARIVQLERKLCVFVAQIRHFIVVCCKFPNNISNTRSRKMRLADWYDGKKQNCLCP
jgi:hypothetical protein